MALGPGPSAVEDIVDDGVQFVGDASKAADDSLSAGTDATDKDGVNTTQVEQEIHARINDVRTERGLPPLQHDPALREIARGHSQDMAANEYFSHEAPDGDNFEDRYQQAGYDCRVSTGGNRYSTGGENIAYTYADSDINVDYGGTVNHNGNETKIAHGLVRGWLNSPGHRDTILQPYWENEGIGVALAEVDGNTRVYATQSFC
ncbi:CAP domain-containing protein [Salinibaculum salinum]|uniref:CAP domain-containing protein n=1 Tax=Salinibaculum salinum TaxID=3131996 RepID=UPI0030EE6C4A